MPSNDFTCSILPRVTYENWCQLREGTYGSAIARAQPRPNPEVIRSRRSPGGEGDQLGAFAGVAAQALKFLIMTAARAVEVIGATSDQTDLDAMTSTIPAKRRKAEPLSIIWVDDREMK